MNGWRLLAAAEDRAAATALLAAAAAAAALPEGPGVVLASGGSSGRRRWCLQPDRHLQQSAAATGRWLAQLGMDPAAVRLVNPLAPHHIGGLMPQVRAQQWQVPLLQLPAAALRQPEQLLLQRHDLDGDGRLPLLSLVPTQLGRLLAHPAGVAWLRCFAVIWVGGAGLPAALASTARRQGLRLAPCYGATETAAMVTALPPDRFLAGEGGCGPPLDDLQLRLEPSSTPGAAATVAVRCDRLSPGWLAPTGLQPLAAADGWWRSGDCGRWTPAGLELLGRSDGAVLSGGVTVHPEEVEAALAGVAGLEALLVLGVPDGDWGERLLALVRPAAGRAGGPLLAALAEAAAGLPPAQRPKQWLVCSELAANDRGKWDRSRWRQWALAALSDGR
ncbi:MAG: AMP-binding protein [Cyanobacteriota bacterium]